MLQFMDKIGVDIEKIRNTHLPEVYTRFQFTSNRKRMSTIIENCGKTEYGHDRRIHMKGASENVFENCHSYLDENGQKVQITDVNKQ
jgi:magnesium-transporting ATPase (P-type)